MRNEGKIEISAGGVLMLAVATLVATGVVFLLGVYVGKGVTEDRLASEQRVVRLPAQAPPGDDPSGDSRQSFWDRTLADEGALPVRPTAKPSPTEVPVRVAPPPAETAAPAATATVTVRPTRPPRATPTPRVVLRGTFQVQVQALSDRAAADRIARELGGKGYEAQLSPAKIEGKTLYRVRVGPFATEEQARAAVGRLKQQGFPNAFLAAGGE